MSDEKKHVRFLMQIFWQAYASENFYRMAKKIGVDFQTWPKDRFASVIAFDSLVQKKGYTAALFEIELTVPEFKNFIGEEEIKIFYTDYLNYIRAVDLARAITNAPEKATQLCNDFLINRKSIVKRYTLNEAVEKFVKDNEEKIKKNENYVVIDGFKVLSDVIAGFEPGRVTIITAETGFGKTNLAINLFHRCIKGKLKPLYANMEMEINDMTKRFLQSAYTLNKKDFEQSTYITRLSHEPDVWLRDGHTAHITDGASMSVADLQTMVSEVKLTQELHIVFADYDQKFVMPKDENDDEWRFIQKVVEQLESMAKREKVHVIMFAQTDADKDGDPRASKRAMQPAASVIYFHKDTDDTVVLKFKKNRFGPTDKKIAIEYDPATSTIIEKGIKENPLPPAGGGNNKRFKGAGYAPPF